LNNPFIDIQKYTLSEEKDRSNKQVERLLKEIAIDCNINTQKIPTGTAGTAGCDYTDCEYTCAIKKSGALLDKSTYSMYIEFFERFDIEYTIRFIKDLFKIFFVWKIDDIIEKIQTKESTISKESIFTALNYLIENKSIIMDSYNRDGYIIQKGNLIIYNPSDKDIQSSIYSKMLDFDEDINKYSIIEYASKKLNTIKSKLKSKSKKETVTIITDDIVEYNDLLIQNNKKHILGTYRDRGTKNTAKYGPITDKFRLIDLRVTDSNNIDDARKAITGMVITSFDKTKLSEICKFLKINNKKINEYLNIDKNIEKHDKNQLAKVIELYLLEKDLVLH
jgi:hypothetical protein